MDDEAAILSAIAAHPDEDTPRLAYADWLDDHAADLPDPAAARTRAQFIRLQCEIAKYADLPSSQQQGYAGLYLRQDAILTHRRRDLLGPLGDELSEIEMTRDVVIERGFVTELRLTAERFGKHGSFVTAMKPLPKVQVTGLADVIQAWGEGGKHFGVITGLVMRRPGSTEPVPLDVSLEWMVNFRTWGGLTRLRELNFEGCSLSDTGLAVLIGIERSLPALTHLDLSINEISDAGVQLLVNSPLWPRLKYLVLGGNPISDEGAFALADAPPTALEYLNLRFTGIGQAGQQRLLRRKGWKVDLF